MLSSQASVDGSESSVMQVAMVSNVPVNASTQALSSTQASLRGPITMATVQIPQMRVLQAIASRPGQPQHFQHPVHTMHQQGIQPQQIQILKAVPGAGGGEVLIPSTLSNLAGMKTSFSPNKGASVVTIPGAKMVSHASLPAKLKVGDTIVIPAKALNSFNTTGVTSGSPIVVKQEQLSAGHLVFTTPTKIIPVSTRSTVVGSPATPQQVSQQRYVATSQPTTPVSNTLASPMRLTTISPSSWTPSPLRYKRAGDYADQDGFSDNMKKARRTPTTSGHDKGSKGLRHFAMLVCEKVKQKITTTYNEVADELVAEYSNSQRHMNDQQYDQKNIRRRVYDALNVLMAMNIIYKDKKDIHWVGLPTNSIQELQALQLEKQKRQQKVQQKTAQLHELILQQIAFKNLVQRNKRLQMTQGPPPANSAIQLPFIIVNTSKKTVIDCSISNDKYEYLFNFDNTFEIHDDIEVLKRMGMAYGLEKGSCSKDDLRTAQSLVPPVLRPYLEEMAGRNGDAGTSTSLTSASSSQTMDPSIVLSSTSDQNVVCSPLDGHRLLSGIKLDPEDQEVATMVMAQSCISEDSQQSSSSGLTLNGPSSRPSSVDIMASLQQVGVVSSPILDMPVLHASALSPGTFET